MFTAAVVAYVTQWLADGNGRHRGVVAFYVLRPRPKASCDHHNNGVHQNREWDRLSMSTHWVDGYHDATTRAMQTSVKTRLEATAVGRACSRLRNPGVPVSGSADCECRPGRECRPATSRYVHLEAGAPSKTVGGPSGGRSVGRLTLRDHGVALAVRV